MLPVLRQRIVAEAPRQQARRCHQTVLKSVRSLHTPRPTCPGDGRSKWGRQMSVAVGAFTNSKRKWWLNAWNGYLSLALAAGAVSSLFPRLTCGLRTRPIARRRALSVGGSAGSASCARPSSSFISRALGFRSPVGSPPASAMHAILATSSGGFCSCASWLGRACSPMSASRSMGPGEAQAHRCLRRQQTVHPGPAADQPVQAELFFCQRRGLLGVCPFYAVAAIAPQWAAPLIVVGTAAGLAAGSVRWPRGHTF